MSSCDVNDRCAMSSCDVNDRRARDGDVDACCTRDGSSVYNITKVILNSRIDNKNI